MVESFDKRWWLAWITENRKTSTRKFEIQNSPTVSCFSIHDLQFVFRFNATIESTSRTLMSERERERRSVFLSVAVNKDLFGWLISYGSLCQCQLNAIEVKYRMKRNRSPQAESGSIGWMKMKQDSLAVKIRVNRRIWFGSRAAQMLFKNKFYILRANSIQARPLTNRAD